VPRKKGEAEAKGQVGIPAALAAAVAALAILAQADAQPAPQPQSVLAERHLANIRQLTAGRKNAEAYFSTDGTKLIFQSTNDWGGGTVTLPAGTPLSSTKGLGCYQIYVLELDTNSLRRVSLGTGANTSGSFFPGDRRVLFASTHLARQPCPPEPKRAGRDHWALDDYDIYSIGLNGQGLHRMTATPGYDAEATIAPDGRTIVFTSMRDGDPDLYAMNLDGTRVRRLTTELGYDGGAFFSPDSKRIVYRAAHPQNRTELEAYTALLAQRLVAPGPWDLFVMNADGSGRRQVTTNGASNGAPAFHPDGQRIIFSARSQDPGTDGPPSSHLHLIHADGTGGEQLTTVGRVNSFPRFSPDGRRLVWVSDRHATADGEVNLFMADWVP